MKKIIVTGIFVFTLVASGCSSSGTDIYNNADADIQQPTGQFEIQAADQKIEKNTISLMKLVVPEDSWIVVRDGDPFKGKIITYVTLKTGSYSDYIVPVPSGKYTKLAIVLNRDLGKKGVFEVPGADIPYYQANGNLALSIITLQ